MRGLIQLQNTLAMIRENLNPDIEIEGILPTLVDTRTVHAKEAIEILEENFGDRVFASRIRKTVRFAEAPVKGMSVLKYDPDGTAANAYRQLAKEVLEMASGKRASMREGPLAALFRRTEEDGLGADARRRPGASESPRPSAPPSPAAVRDAPAAARRVRHACGEVRRREPAPAVPSPRERLRHAFSVDDPREHPRSRRPDRSPGARAPARGLPSRARPRAAPRVGGPARCCAWSASAAPASTPSTAWSRPRSRASSSSPSTPTCSRCSSRPPTSRCTSARGHARPRARARTPTSVARRRWRSTTRSRRCSRARTWSSSPRAPAAAPAPAPRPSSRASPASSAR